MLIGAIQQAPRNSWLNQFYDLWRFAESQWVKMTVKKQTLNNQALQFGSPFHEETTPGTASFIDDIQKHLMLHSALIN